MNQRKTPAVKNDINRTGAALKVVLLYSVFASIWILLSDKTVASLFSDNATILLISIIKGWLFVAVTALLLFFLIRRLLGRVLSEAESAFEAHADKTRTQNLLDNIAASSPDTIYAKDLDGNYLMVNREAVRLTGKTSEQVLGRDDSILFPEEQATKIRASDLQVIAQNQTISYEVALTT
ncbi:MAG: PAS domain S-box protein, partial [Burkholderiaceae bacterium]